jgi:hypothetical protein
MWMTRTFLAVLFLTAAVPDIRADRQSIAPGIGSQTAVVQDTGANGVCETTARRDDVQALAVGMGSPFEIAVECGIDAIANTAAGSDDRQLIPVGSPCPGPNANVVDTGPNGIAESTVVGDDQQLLAPGTGAPNTPCIRTGANGLADTDPAGDDVRVLAMGTAEANTAVIRCGANQVAETFANNARAGGDDVQRIGVGGGCPGAQAIIVDAGANGIAETRAQGAELVVSPVRPLKLTIPRRRNLVSRKVKVVIANREFGTGAPAARTFTLGTDSGSCPNGVVREVDADARTAGVQTSASVPLGRQAKATMVVAVEVADVTSVARNIPFRCQLTVTAEAVDTAPAADDATNPANNTARIEVEIADRNDLP